MGWIIAIIIIILIASGGSKNGNTGSAGNDKGGYINPSVKKEIDLFVSLMHTKPVTPEIQEKIDVVVDLLLDAYLYYFNKYLDEVKECSAIAAVLSQHPMFYRGKKYPPYRGQLVEYVIYDLINDPRYIYAGRHRRTWDKAKKTQPLHPVSLRRLTAWQNKPMAANAYTLLGAVSYPTYKAPLREPSRKEAAPLSCPSGSPPNMFIILQNPNIFIIFLIFIDNRRRMC